MIRTGCAFLLLCLLLSGAAWAQESIVYGTSEQGRELICYRVGDVQAEHALLMVFGIHGFEDIYDHDGELLRDIAWEIIHHYEETPAEVCLYIIPSANPDGLIDGVSCNDFGRLTASGIDPNRDFPIRWKKRQSSSSRRNDTGETPFSTAETRAIRDLVEVIQPTWGIDVHGYINAVYGEGRMAKVFASAMKLQRKDPLIGGMMYEWFDACLDGGIMLELPGFTPDTGFDPEVYVQENALRIIRGIDAWIADRRGAMVPTN